MTQPQNDPNAFPGLPYEMQNSGDYTKLANVKHANYVLMERHRIPAALFDKHRAILVRSFWERQPLRTWDQKYAKFTEHMKNISDPESNPELWIKEAEDLIPYDYLERLKLADKMPGYQRIQFDDVLQLLTHTQYKRFNDPKAKVHLTAHTVTSTDLPRFFDVPDWSRAVATFPTIPQHRREQWFDLLIHFVIGAQLLPESQEVKRCFNKEVRLLRHWHHTHPCHGAGHRYQSGWNFWQDKLGKIAQSNGYCVDQKIALRRAMIQDPDFDQARHHFGQFMYCVNTHRHKENILGHIRRNPQVDAEYDKRPTWMQMNMFKHFSGNWGPGSRSGFDTEEEYQKDHEQYTQSIQTLLEPLDIQDANGNVVLQLP